jgi:hypothetical protein
MMHGQPNIKIRRNVWPNANLSNRRLTLAAIGSIPGLHGKFCVTCIEYFSLMQESLLNTKTNFFLLKQTQKKRRPILFASLDLVSYCHPAICTEPTRMNIATLFICSTRTDNGVVVGGRPYTKRVSILKNVAVLAKFEVT